MNKSESKYFNSAVKMGDALVELLEKKTFEYITVSEICARAGVHRSTFYLHYENTNDLLAEVAGRIMDGFLTYFSVERKDISLRFSDCDLHELNYITGQYLHPYLMYVRDNRRVFLTVLSRADTFRFESIFQRMFEHIFNPILDRFHYPPEDRKYIMRFYLNGLNAVVLEWLKDDCRRSIQEMDNVIHECIFGLEKACLAE